MPANERERVSRELTTIDGRKMESCRYVTLYTHFGKPVSGEIHHYGGGWQIGGIDGPYVGECFADKINALRSHRESLAAVLRDIDAEIIALERTSP